MKLKNFLTIIFLLHCSIIFGQDKRSLTIEEAIKIGLENSKMLNSSFMKVESAFAKYTETRANLFPSLKFATGFTRLSDVPPFELPVNLPFIPAGQKFTIGEVVLNNYVTRLSIQQPLFTGFRIYNSVNLTKLQVEATQKDYEKDKAELIYNIKNSYWSLFKAELFKKVVDENVEQVSAHLKNVKSLFEQGLATTNDVLRVQTQLSNIKVAQIDADNAVKLATIGLCSIIGLPLDSEIELASQVENESRDFGDLKTLIQKAMENRQDIKSMELRVKAGEAGVTVSRAGWYPQVFLTGNYYYSRPNQRYQPIKDEFNDSWDLGISISVDLWNWGMTSAQTTQAQANLIQVKNGLLQLKDAVTLEVTQNYLNVSQAFRKIKVAEEGVNQAEENYKVTKNRFEQGLSLNTDLLDAEVSLLQAKTNYTNAIVDYEIAVARLEKTVGK